MTDSSQNLGEGKEAAAYSGNPPPAGDGIAAFVQRVEQLAPGEKQDFFNQLNFENKQELFCQLRFEDKQKLYNELSPDDKQKLFAQLSSQEQQNISGIGSPDQQVSDRLWLIVVGSFAFVLLGAFLSVAISVLISIFRPINSVEFQILLTMFTSAVGFLAGVLVPPPARGNPSQGGR